MARTASRAAAAGKAPAAPKSAPLPTQVNAPVQGDPRLAALADLVDQTSVVPSNEEDAEQHPYQPVPVVQSGKVIETGETGDEYLVVAYRFAAVHKSGHNVRANRGDVIVLKHSDRVEWAVESGLIVPVGKNKLDDPPADDPASQAGKVDEANPDGETPDTDAKG